MLCSCLYHYAFGYSVLHRGNPHYFRLQGESRTKILRNVVFHSVHAHLHGSLCGNTLLCLFAFETCRLSDITSRHILHLHFERDTSLVSPDATIWILHTVNHDFCYGSYNHLLCSDAISLFGNILTNKLLSLLVFHLCIDLIHIGAVHNKETIAVLQHLNDFLCYKVCVWTILLAFELCNANDLSVVFRLFLIYK